MSTISAIAGREILDSRGRPTVEARCTLRSGASATASAPSGLSTGRAEARELRDGDPLRYRGLGCRHAVAGLNDEIHSTLVDQTFQTQQELDGALVALDGTPDKARLGSNALLAVSLAFARAVATERRSPLYRHLGDEAGFEANTLPRPTINLFSGGKHAGGQVPIQDVLIVPLSPRTIDDCLSMTFEIYQRAAERAADRYGTGLLTADEGGLAPPFRDAETMLAEAVAAIQTAGFEPGSDAALAVDVAASHFFDGTAYQLGEEMLTSTAMIDRVDRWVERFPIISVEDGLAEDDWQHWPVLRERLGNRAAVLGDDLLCTNPVRIQRAIDTGAADALLVKVNQIGTLSEAAHALISARKAGWSITVSARSGETEDTWLADLAVGWSADHIKVGSITQSERLAKYNRLLQIEAETRHEIPQLNA
jgi:enolase